jgi:hypothetical protein
MTGLALTGCKVSITVDVRSDDLGAGEVAVTAELDRDATSALVVVQPTSVPVAVAPVSAAEPSGSVPDATLTLPTTTVPGLTGADSGTRLNLADFRSNGWTGPGLSPRADGTSSFNLSHPFSSVAEANSLLASLSGTDGPLADLRLKRNRSFVGTTITLVGPGNFTKGLAGFGDARIATVTNSGPFGLTDKEVLRQSGATSLDKVIAINVVSNLNGNRSTAALPVGKATPIAMSGRSWAWATIASFSAGILGIVAFLSLRSRRSDDDDRYSSDDAGREPGDIR